MKTTELVNDQTIENTPVDIEEILAGYNKTPIQVDAEPGTENTPLFDNEPNRIEPDINDPRYFYQSGKKKGQPRPNRGVRVDANFKGIQDDVISGEILSGMLFLTLIDLIIPLLITVLNNKFSDNKISEKDLHLSEKQKKELEPLAEKVMKQITISANPIFLLSISMIGIYGLNFAALKMKGYENK